jgi:hypothetical protein
MNILDSTMAHPVDLKADVVKQRGLDRAHDSYASDETLVVDARDGVRPCQMVEKKLIWALRNAYRPVSHTLTRGLSNGRSHR